MEHIIDVGHTSISFNRADMNYSYGCTFCKRDTRRALAHKLAKDTNWEVLPVCDGCMHGLKKIPVTSEEKPSGQGN